MGRALPFLADAASFAVSLLCVGGPYPVAGRTDGDSPHRGLRADIAEGSGWIWAHRQLAATGPGDVRRGSADARPLGPLVAGLLLEYADARVTAVLLGGYLVLCVILAAANPGFRGRSDHDRPAEDTTDSAPAQP